MAKSKRSSSRKANNQRLAATLFGPAVTARAERMSAKLLELAKQPKPETSDAKTEEDADVVEDEPAEDEPVEAGDAAMDVDKKRTPSKRIVRKRIDKRKTKKASIVFPKYSDRLKAKKNQKKA